MTTDALAAHLDDIWTEIDKKAPRRPTTATKDVLADWKDDIWVDTDRKSPHRPIVKPDKIVVAGLTVARRRESDDRPEGTLTGE